MLSLESQLPLWGSLLAVVAFDLLIGDPRSQFHPIVLMGNQVKQLERVLRAWQWDGRLGGCVLLLGLALPWCGGAFFLEYLFHGLLPTTLADLCVAMLASVFLAQRSLCEHGLAVGRAAEVHLDEARHHTSMLVGREVSQLDEDGCRRAAVESLAENFVDGVFTPLFYFTVMGFHGMVFFKIASTLDSMVGYKNETYLHFGWAGARMDDLLNFVPARLSVFTLAFSALIHPYLSAKKALAVAWNFHHLLPSPNSGWSEASVAGALQKRLCGPIYKKGVLICTVWVGAPEDPIGCSYVDLQRCIYLIWASTTTWIFLCYLFG